MNSSINRVAVTVDIEDWYHLTPITGAPNSAFRDVPQFFSIWNSRYDYLSKPTIKILDLLKEINVKATFFIVADVVEHYPGLVEKITKDGHEIACHGLHHACKIHPKTKLPLMPKEEFKERTLLAKTILEKASGQKVLGYRAPNAFISGWMIDILEELGFQYDSSVSVNSFYNKSDIMLKGVKTTPYFPNRRGLEAKNGKGGILELPWPYFQLLAKFPTAGGPVLRFFGAQYIMLGLNQSLKRGDTLFYFHPIDIADEDFPMNTALMQKLFWMEKGKIIEKRIKYILDRSNTRIFTIRELINNY